MDIGTWLSILLAFLSGIAAACAAVSRILGPESSKQGDQSYVQLINVGQKRANGKLGPDTTIGAEASQLAENLAQVSKEVQELKAELLELRQLVVHQHETDAERQQDSSELLLALWSENFKEEFECQWADALACLRTDVSSLKAMVNELPGRRVSEQSLGEDLLTEDATEDGDLKDENSLVGNSYGEE